MKIFILFNMLSICNFVICMDPSLAALHTAQYAREHLKGEPLGYLSNIGSWEIRQALRQDAQQKYDLLTQGWKSNNASPLKPFEQCTWNDIEAAFNGDSSRLVSPYINKSAKY